LKLNRQKNIYRIGLDQNHDWSGVKAGAMEKNIATKQKKSKNTKDPEQGAEFFGLITNLMDDLSSRSRDIVQRRYGLSNDKGETLEAIGREFGVTRERVRQILSDVIRNISSKSDDPDFKKVEEKIIFTIEKNNGIIRESEIIRKFNTDGPREANAIRLFMECSKNIFPVEKKGLVEKSWVSNKSVIEELIQSAEEAERIFLAENRIMASEEIASKLSSSLENLTREKALSFLSVLSRIEKNKFEKWGIRGWVEVNPKGTRERIYLIMKELGKPLHFTEIAKLIDKHNLGKRKAHPQTVHNELIKDERFVLIGRGIYAMAEWGYTEGTIRDVLEDILKKSPNPLTKDEILDRILKMRKVKKTTVMINLNNSDIFERKGVHYSVRK
jgi:hypothetical protein